MSKIQCTQCHELKDQSDYYKREGYKINHPCKDCTNSQRKETYNKRNRADVKPAIGSGISHDKAALVESIFIKAKWEARLKDPQHPNRSEVDKMIVFFRSQSQVDPKFLIQTFNQ